jgi:Rrf2 family protein
MNTRFAVATHLLSFLTFAGNRLVTSDEIAESVKTHPALVRRMLSLLREAGLVETQLGPGGGARLALQPETISLLDIYQAIDTDDDLFAVGRISPNPKCPLGANIQATLECVLAAPQAALRNALGRVTIREVCDRAMAGTGESAAHS